MYRYISRVGLLILFNLVIAGAMLVLASPEAPLPPPTNNGIREGYVLVEGDIVLPLEALETRATYRIRPWTNGIVPYAFADYISLTNRNRMRAAMDTWEAAAGVTFVPRTSETNYLYLIEAQNETPPGNSGNWSYVGMIGGRQELSMFNWTYHYIIAHELAHTLGFWHEQSRPDRDRYVEIMWDNIQAGAQGNFALQAAASTYGDYDFESVMHYSPGSFSTNGKPTIVAKPAYAAYQSLMGQRSRLSELDKAGMRELYPTPDTRKTAFTIPIQSAYSTTINTASLTLSQNEPRPTCSANIGATAWYKIKPQNEQILSISASGFNTVLAVYTGNNNAWRQHGCANNFSNNTAETLTVSAKANQTYFIVIGGENGATGPLNLTVNSTRNLISNGDFEWGAESWAVTSGPSNRADDKVSCGAKAIKQYNSRCSFQFKGGADENSVFKQSVKAAMLPGMTFVAGHSLSLRFNIASVNTTSAVVGKINIKYHNGTTQVFETPVQAVAGGSSQFYISPPIILNRGDVKKITLAISNKSAGGKVFIDSVQLLGTLGTPLRADELLPMP